MKLPRRIIAFSTLGSIALLMAACDGGTGPSPVPPPPRSPAAPDPATPGDPAGWRIEPGQTLTESSTKITARVSRLACNGGVTGQVLPPKIDRTGPRIVITFQVTPQQTGAAECMGNDEVRYEVDLGEPLRGRPLIDGQCLTTPNHCGGKPTRFPE
jgi:hypothetical protein